jgi:hypothetical protein
MLRPLAWLLAVALIVPASTPSRAGSTDQIEPACLQRIRSRLPGPVKSTSIRTTTIKGKQLGAKRLLFRRGEVLLVVNHEVLHSRTVAFLEKNGAKRFPEEASMLRQFLNQLERMDEAEIDETKLTNEAQRRLSYRLAAVLDEGAFEIRPLRRTGRNRSSSSIILRLDWSYYCGDLCAGEGRVFITEDCQELVSVTDIIS